MYHDSRLVLVPAPALADLCNLVEIALSRLDDIEPHDPLQPSLRGALADIKANCLLEPTL